MASSKPVLFILTAGNCGSCKAFLADKKEGWDALKAKVDHDKKLRLVYVEVANTSSAIDYSVYPEDLSRYIGFFPHIGLYSGSSWDQAIANKGQRIALQGVVFNGVWEGGRITSMKTGRKEAKVNNIMSWVDSNLPILSSLSTSSLPPQSPASKPADGLIPTYPLCARLNQLRDIR